MARSSSVLEKPDIPYISALIDQGDSDDAKLRKRWELVRAVRAREHTIDVPVQFQKTTSVFRSHWGEDIIGRVVAHVTRNMPSVSVPPWNLSDTAQRNSTLREKWTNGAITQLDRESQPDRWFRASMDHAASYGMGVYKLLHVSQAWPDYPIAETRFKKSALDLSDDERKTLTDEQEQAKQAKVPFWISAVDPRTWHGFYSDRRLTECVEVSERTVGSILRRYPGWQWDAGGRTFQKAGLSRPRVVGGNQNSYAETVTWCEHWNQDYVTYAVGGSGGSVQTIVEQFEHHYKEPPYYPFFGTTNGTMDPGQRPISIIDHVLDLIILFDTLTTYWLNYAHLSAFPMWTLEAVLDQASDLGGGDGDADEQLGADIQYEPGKIARIPRGWKTGLLQVPAIGQDILKIIESIERTLNNVVPNVMRGVGESGQPGYAIRQLIDAFKIVLDPQTEAASLALERLILHMWWLIEHRIGESVPVLTDSPKGKSRAWLSLGPDDIRGYYACSVSIAAYLPNTAVMDGQFGLQQVQGGAISMKRHRQEYLHIENPEEEQDQIWIEQELSDPQSPTRQAMRDRALKRAGMLDDREQQQKDALLGMVPLPPGFEAGLAGGQTGGAMGPGGEAAAMPNMVPGLPPMVQGEPAPPGIAPELVTPGAGLPPGQFPGGGLPSGMPGGRAAGAERMPPGGG